jgi:hypothetical protein
MIKTILLLFVLSSIFFQIKSLLTSSRFSTSVKPLRNYISNDQKSSISHLRSKPNDKGSDKDDNEDQKKTLGTKNAKIITKKSIFQKRKEPLSVSTSNSKDGGRKNSDLNSSGIRSITSKSKVGNKIQIEDFDDDDDYKREVSKGMEGDDVKWMNEAALRSFWVKAGNNDDSYNEDIALRQMLMSDDDDDDDEVVLDVSGDDSIINEAKVEEKSVFKSRKQLLKKSVNNIKNIDIKNENIEIKEDISEEINDTAAVVEKESDIPQGRSVGIDLGTTNSAISIIEGGKPVIIPINGGRIVPSIVGYSKKGEVIIGENARRQSITNPKNTFSSIKRIIGKSLKEIESSGEKLSFYKINKKCIKNDDIQIECPNLLRNLSPIEVSAEILKNLVSEASKYLKGEIISKAVITVPAYFLPHQCEATIKAGEQAGLLRIKLLREPEAAALAYGLTQRNRQIVLVFDLGGGTFDVSVLEVGDGFVEVYIYMCIYVYLCIYTYTIYMHI